MEKAKEVLECSDSQKKTRKTAGKRSITEGDAANIPSQSSLNTTPVKRQKPAAANPRLSTRLKTVAAKKKKASTSQ
ncbi:hypothetical protein ACP70R_017100 [Stipagrostis hirtigluma subsp. patula]